VCPASGEQVIQHSQVEPALFRLDLRPVHRDFHSVGPDYLQGLEGRLQLGQAIAARVVNLSAQREKRAAIDLEYALDLGHGSLQHIGTCRHATT